MKKFLSKLLLGAATLGVVVSFAACNPDGAKVETTVTAEKWETAFGYFSGELDEDGFPALSGNPRTNFTCFSVYSYHAGDSIAEYETTISLDFDKSALLFEFPNSDSSTSSCYAWKDGDKYYSVGVGWKNDEESGETRRFYEKSEENEDDHLISFEANIFYYAGGEYIYELNLAEKFEDFTYSAENGEYTATVNSEYSGDVFVTVKFENGKIAYMSLALNDRYYGESLYTFTYTYGISVNVPDLYLNADLGEIT